MLLMRFVTSEISPSIQALPPGRISADTRFGLTSAIERSGTTFSPPILTTRFLVRPTDCTENPKVLRSSASAEAGSQSAKPSKTKTCTVRLLMVVCSQSWRTVLEPSTGISAQVFEQAETSTTQKPVYTRPGMYSQSV